MLKIVRLIYRMQFTTFFRLSRVGIEDVEKCPNKGSFRKTYLICHLRMIPLFIFVPKGSGLGFTKYVRKGPEKAPFPCVESSMLAESNCLTDEEKD
jgi:hypothetical protein